MVDLIVVDMVIYWFCIKIAGGINKKFIIEAEVKLVVLEIVMVDGVDKHKEIALSK